MSEKCAEIPIFLFGAIFRFLFELNLVKTISELGNFNLG